MKAIGSLLLCDESRYPTLSDQLKGMKHAGFTAVELAAFETWGKGLSPRQLASDQKYFRETVKTINRFKIETPAINCSPGPELLKGGSDEIEAYAEEIAAIVRLAQEIGATRVTTGIPQAPEHWEIGKTEIEYAQRWLKVLEIVRPPEEIKFGSEVHANTFMERPTSALRVVKQLWPSIGITYDPSHQIMIGVPLEDTLPLMPYVNQAHLRDARPGEMQAVFGQGTLDIEWVLRQLTKNGYNGPVTVEHFADFDPEFESSMKLKAAIENYPI